METLVGLMLAASPVAITAVLLFGAERRQRRRQSEVARQIALTDALHARLGALVAPVVRLQRGVWHVSVAVPVEQPGLVSAVLATVDDVFGRAAYELRLQRQAPVAPAAQARVARARQESLSWT
jgi:hypothetical protein